MAQFTVTVNAATNGKPTAIGRNTIIIPDPDAAAYVFTVADFTTNTTPAYLDPEGDAMHSIKITNYLDLDLGLLKFQGTTLTSGDIGLEITAAQLANGDLTYTPEVGTGYLEFFEFDVKDVGSGLYSGLPTGIMNMQVAATLNLPPTIGDGSATMDYQGTLVFTRDMFTTLTVPPYSDPEGDAALELKILTLPLETGMKLNGLPVSVNQVIQFSDIDAGLFTYTNDDVYDTNGDTQTFTFAIRDAGSGLFVT